jgi:SAM-dependent methyltransferase
MPSFLETISPEPLRRALAELTAGDAAARVQLYLLGQDRLLQWAHSVGVATNAALRASVSPVPPLELRRLDAATEEPLYLYTGLVDITSFFAIYQRLGTAPDNRNPRVLDFGCDSGRLARYLNMHEAIEPFAVDANPLLVEWCQLNLSRVVTLLQAGRQHLPFGDAMFDFVYAMSLFTGAVHSRMQQWFDEITRMLCPGGLLLAVTYGPTALATIRGSPTHQAMFRITAARAAELLETLPAEGCIHVPYAPDAAPRERTEAGDGYTFVHPDYPAGHWNTNAFEVLQHIAGGLRGWQDVIVLRRKEPEPAA